MDRNRTLSPPHLFVALVLAIASTTISPVAAKSQPKDDDLHRFITPGEEETILGKLPTSLSAEAIGIELSPGLTVESASEAFPKYFWQTSLHTIFGDYVRDPDDLTGRRLVYFYGLENAKIMVYRNMISSMEKVNPKSREDKLFITSIPSFDDFEFGCMTWQKIGMLGISKKSEEDRRAGNAWFACTANTQVPVLVGIYRQ